MDITVLLGGPLRKRIEGHEHGLLTIQLPEGSRVSDAFAALNLEHDDVRVLMKNGRAIQDDALLADGDRLGLFPREQAFNVITAISFFNPLAKKKEG